MDSTLRSEQLALIDAKFEQMKRHIDDRFTIAAANARTELWEQRLRALFAINLALAAATWYFALTR